MKINRAIAEAKALVSYAVKMLTMPVGTKFEFRNQQVNRFAYTYHTCKFLWNATHPGRPRWSIRWRVNQILYCLDTARWRFFAYNPLGARILDAVDRLHSKYPESAVVHKLWIQCLPF